MPVTGFFTPPPAARYALRRVSVPASLLMGATPAPANHDDLVPCDIVIDEGTIADVARAGSVEASLGPDLDGALVLPGMLDAHAHLDKGHIVPRARNQTGDLSGAAAVTGPDRAARWHADDVRRRLEFGLQTAYAKGVVAIRTHLDSLAPQPSVTFPVFAKLRDEWAGRVELQPSTICPIDIYLTDQGRDLADRVAAIGGNLGSGTRFVAPVSSLVPPEFDTAMENVFKLAQERGLDLDLHVDESSDPESRTLIRIARIAVKRGFKGRILAGHCTALALQTDEYIRETMDVCKDAGIDFVSLPAVNLYLQARGPFGNVPRKTPHWRGVTLIHELKAHGFRVAVGGDNVRDPFYGYGDHDMLETFSQAVKIAHLDHPHGNWITAATSVPAAIMQLDGRFGRVGRGRSADLIVLPARDYNEMLSRFQSERVVIRRGRAIDTSLPDYRRLDDLVRIASPV